MLVCANLRARHPVPEVEDRLDYRLTEFLHRRTQGEIEWSGNHCLQMSDQVLRHVSQLRLDIMGTSCLQTRGASCLTSDSGSANCHDKFGHDLFAAMKR